MDVFQIGNPWKKGEYFPTVCSRDVLDECIEYLKTYQNSSSLERELDSVLNLPQDEEMESKSKINLEEKVKSNNIFVRMRERVKEYFK